MPDTARQTISARSETHSDVADTPAARAYQAALTEQKFGEQILRRLRQAGGAVKLGNLQEEWVSVEGGLVHEITVDVEPIE